MKNVALNTKKLIKIGVNIKNVTRVLSLKTDTGKGYEKKTIEKWC